MWKNLPKQFRLAALFQMLGMALLCLSLSVGTALPYIITIGSGSVFLLLSLFCFVWLFFGMRRD